MAWWGLCHLTFLTSYVLCCDICGALIPPYPHTHLFLWKVGTSHRRNGFYTVQTVCYCPTPTLHLNLALTGDCAFLLLPPPPKKKKKKTHSVWFISVLKSGDMGQCPHKSPSPCNTYVIPVSYTHTHTHTHTHTLLKHRDLCKRSWARIICTRQAVRGGEVCVC